VAAGTPHKIMITFLETAKLIPRLEKKNQLDENTKKFVFLIGKKMVLKENEIQDW
jgi:hypothetical protein